MKVLFSAIACDPYAGSENYGGWSTVQCLARDHELWVITSEQNRTSLERAAGEGLVPQNVHFAYAGRSREWHPNRMIARFESWHEYVRFSGAILEVARALHRTVAFDLAHHVTYATWRVATPLWKLGIPLIFGPIGGNEQFPLRFLPMLSSAAAGFELCRVLSNGVSRLSPSVRASLRQAAHVFAANAETERLIEAVRRSPAGVSRLMQTFYSEERMQALLRHGTSKNLEGPLRLFAGGNLEGRKGIALALEALAQVKAGGVRFHYHAGGNGPELGYLQKRVQQLGLEREVSFGFLPRADYQKELGAAHVCLLPSLRDSVGATVMEAMLAGAVPVVADCGGPAHVVTEACGCKIPVTNRPQMVHDLACAILNLDRHREIISQKGAAAAKRVAATFTEQNYRNTINSVYRLVTKGAGP